MDQLAFLRIAVLGLPLSLAAHDSWAQPSSLKFEEDVHGHTFYSERIDGEFPFIDYLVCNKSDSKSDFFWTVAGFGVSDGSLPPHHCLQKTDYVGIKDSSQPQSDSIPAEVNVRSDLGEVPTLYWCEYRGLDRCGDSLLSSLAFWSSTLREFAEGGTDEPFRPTISVESALEGGRYKIDIKRSNDSGDLLVIARTFQPEGVRLEPGDQLDAKPGSLGNFFPVSDTGVSTGLSDDMPTLAVFTTAASDLGVRVYFQNLTSGPVELTFAVLSDNGIVLRLDSIGLPPNESLQ